MSGWELRRGREGEGEGEGGRGGVFWMSGWEIVGRGKSWLIEGGGYGSEEAGSVI